MEREKRKTASPYFPPLKLIATLEVLSTTSEFDYENNNNKKFPQTL